MMNPKMNLGGMKRQQGAALLMVVIIFLLLLPILIGTFVKHTLSNTETGVSAETRASASDAAGRALADMRQQLDTALVGGLLEYQYSPPAWFIKNPVDVRSSSFWSSCAADKTCVTQTITQPVGTGADTTPFTVSELVTPTGVTDPLICGQDGFVAVFYNVLIHAQAANIPADGGATMQSVYRSCQRL